MTPLPAYVPRLPQPVPMPVRAMPAPSGSPAARDGAEAGTEQRRRDAQPPVTGLGTEAMGRVIGMLRRVASGEAVGDGMAAEARQVLSLLGAPQPQGAEAARRVRLDVVA